MNSASGVELDDTLNGEVKPPEVHLWASVLHLAILDATPYMSGTLYLTYDQCRHGKTALNWLRSEHNNQGSFRWVCDILKLDRSKVRCQIGLKDYKIW